MSKSNINTDRLIKVYKSGKTISESAKIVGCATSHAWKVLNNASIDTSHRSTRSPRIDLPVERIIRLYESGKSILALSKIFDVSRNVIENRLKRNGVAIRDGSQANHIRMSKLSEKERRELTKSANETIRNMPDEFHEQSAIKQAKAKEKTLSKRGDLEKSFQKALEERGFTVIPQKAVYVYNIDLAVRNTAVEVHVTPAHPHNSSFYIPRIVYLLKSGWNVIYIKVTSDVFIQRTANKISAMIDLIESNKSSVCKYGMIRGSGELVASGSLNGDKLSTVDASDGFFARIC